jgi:hypothetical protein
MAKGYKDSMFEDHDYTAIDVIALERRARTLRAQAMREAVAGVARWIAARFKAAPATGAQRA